MKNGIVILLLISWYYLFYQLFLVKDLQNEDSPQLRARLGTILWHSSDRNGETNDTTYYPKPVAHTYCYYPKGSTQYSNKSGEYIIKRVDDDNCDGWYGQAVFYESYWVSEKEKIWWNKDQKINEELVNLQQKTPIL